METVLLTPTVQQVCRVWKLQGCCTGVSTANLRGRLHSAVCVCVSLVRAQQNGFTEMNDANSASCCSHRIKNWQLRFFWDLASYPAQSEQKRSENQIGKTEWCQKGGQPAASEASPEEA